MIAGIAGHQNLGEAAAVAWARGALLDLLQRFPITSGLTSLAVGADQLFAEVLLEKRVPFDAVIPCARYEEAFEAPSLVSFENLLSKASSRVVLPYPFPSEEAFWNAGKYIVDHSDLVVAVWDGEAARGLGGTADVVQYALTVGREVVHVNPVDRTTRSL